MTARNQQECSKPEAPEEMVNLVEYWNIIVKRKKLIAGIFLICILSTALFSFLTPKIYKGEAILKIGKGVTKRDEAISPGEIASLINSEEENYEAALPKTMSAFQKVRAAEEKGTENRVRVTFDLRQPQYDKQALDEFLAYLNNQPSVTAFREKDLEATSRRLKKLEFLIKEYEAAIAQSEKRQSNGTALYLPDPVNYKIALRDTKEERELLESAALQYRLIELSGEPRVLKAPVRPKLKPNMLKATIAGFFLSFFVVGALEWIQAARKRATGSEDIALREDDARGGGGGKCS